MKMKGFIYFLGLLVIFIGGCKPQPPEVIIVPPEETPRDLIDNYYFVKFGWGKTSDKDTITIEIPDDTLGSDTMPFEWDLELDYMLTNFDLKHEKIHDTTGWSAELEWDSGDEFKDLFPDDYNDFRDEAIPIGYHYAPATFCYPRGLRGEWVDNSGGSFEEIYPQEVDVNPEATEKDYLQKYYKNIFGIIFPWNIDTDTSAFWDIQDYLDNPSAKIGNQKWGRVGAEEWIYYPDTFLMWNNDAYTGVVISFTDDQHIEWRSDNYPTFQDGSYLIITDRILNQRDGLTYFIIEGEFTVNLYNDNGEFKLAKGGKFRLPVLADVPLDPQPE
jgi:hypothetical protein